MKPELKKAFRKTIERWEKIVDDVTYFARSDCDLCAWALRYAEKGRTACSVCLIGKKCEDKRCYGTPYADFEKAKTKENALRELVFLKDLYIELIECPKPHSLLDGASDEYKKELAELWEKKRGMREKRAKKEEWVDVTKEVTWGVEKVTKFYYLRIFYDKEIIARSETFDGGKKISFTIYNTDNHKIEWYDGDFKIFKKEKT